MLQRFHLSRGFAGLMFVLAMASLSGSEVLAQADAGQRGPTEGSAEFSTAHPAVPSPSPVKVGAELTCPGCEDSNACTVDTCDTATGTCRHDPLSCDDGNPCTNDECRSYRSNYGAVGGCFHSPRPDATPCDDGETCTIGEACSAGACVPGGILGPGASCDDGNSCTVSDACDDAAHCHGTPLGGGAGCDDRNACTRDDRCVTQGDVVVCEGTAQDCADGDLCTQDRCDPATGACVHPPVDCADGNSCTTDVCDPATGQCRRDNVAGACSDGRICTTGQSCVSGNCVGGEPVVCPQPQCGSNVCMEEDGGCRLRDWGGNGCPADGQCTSTSCVNNHCQTTNLSFTPCTLQNFCGIAQCIRGDCQAAVTFPCSDDGNACTDEVCSRGSCTHPSKPDGTSCGDACSNGACQAGACVAGTPPSCDDFNPCTVDSCDPVDGCKHTPLNCDDGNACTRDLCSTTTGQCLHDPENNIPCPGPGVDACHASFCVQGACTGVAPVNCDDGKVCTIDSCDVNQGGCVHRDSVCDDGNTCTVDNCSATGTCQHIAYPVGFPCSDNNACTTHDLCAGPAEARVCAGTGPSCDDGNPCTTDVGIAEDDTCVCDHLPVESACCTGGGPRSCDDGNPCTADRCAPDVGCVHDPVEHRVSCGVGACERTVDTCAPPGAVCVPGTPAPETCNNRVDEDCDGLVDERETLPACAVRPLVMRDGGALPSFSVTCRWTPICAGAPAPIPLDAIGTVWLSAADLLFDPADNEALPDPFAHCAEAIVENPARRMVSDTNVMFFFDPTGDGVCGTSGGGRPGLVKALADVPDGKLARVCVKWRNVALVETERCGTVLVKHDASTEPQPLRGPTAGEGSTTPPAP